MSNQAKWRSYTKEELENIVANSFSYREVAQKLGYQKDGGGTIKSLHNMVNELSLDVSHFKGQGWNKNNYVTETLTMNTKHKRGKNILATVLGLKHLERKCEQCGLSEWLGQDIPLQVHHINGNHNDNRLENLQVLCLNCHGLTDSYCIPKKYRINK